MSHLGIPHLPAIPNQPSGPTDAALYEYLGRLKRELETQLSRLNERLEALETP